MDNTDTESLKTLTIVVYVLQALSFFVGITMLAAIIINYVKRDETGGTLYESHFRWQIRTFWFGLLWGVIGGIATLIGIGLLILFADAIWVIYRIIKGWLNLNDNKEMYAA